MQECVGQNKFTSSDSDAIRTFQIFSDVMTKQSIDPTQELTRSEIDSREIDLVLFIHLLTTYNFPLLLRSTEHRKIVTYFTQLITSNY